MPSDEDQARQQWSDNDSGIFSASENEDGGQSDDEDDDEDVAAHWRPLHHTIESTIVELGGKVIPKLNWSAPKDATWINANSMECRSANDVYLLLKSSDFITHDLEHAFDDCIDSPNSTLTKDDIPFHLVLRKYVPKFNPSVEFRCFVRERKLLCICQRDLNHFDFLFKMQNRLRSLISEFFGVRLRDSFPDENFAFDIYVPPPYDRVWLVDFNPWALRTDPLLFSWMELLSMPGPPEPLESESSEDDFVRLSLHDSIDQPADQVENGATDNGIEDRGRTDSEIGSEDGEDLDLDYWLPELRLVRKTDPEAYSFNTYSYSAHKMPKDVVDASQGGGEGLREFAREWQDVLEQRRQQDEAAESSEDE